MCGRPVFLTQLICTKLFIFEDKAIILAILKSEWRFFKRFNSFFKFLIVEKSLKTFVSSVVVNDSLSPFK